MLVTGGAGYSGSHAVLALIDAEWPVAALDDLLTGFRFAVPESVADPLAYYDNNTAKSRALIAAAVRAGVPHFIFSSLAAVYGVPEFSTMTEDTPRQPINPMAGPS